MGCQHHTMGLSLRPWPIECTWQVRLATKRRIAPTPDYATLKRCPIVAAAYDAALRRGLATVAVDDGDAAGRLWRLCEATRQAASGLPLLNCRPLRRRNDDAAVPKSDERVETTIAATSTTKWATERRRTVWATCARWRG